MATGKLPSAEQAASSAVLEPVPPDTRYMGKLEVGSKADLKPGERERIIRGMPKDAPPVKKYAKGGYTTSADGCVSKGKTKGRMV